MGPLQRFGFVFAFGATISGCNTTAYRPRLASEIGEDAASFSNAYARAANNQILLNILRARDRAPRHYTVVTGISDKPTAVNEVGLNISTLNLNNALNPYRNSQLGPLKSTITTQPSYSVNPLAEANLGKIYQPLSGSSLQAYWESDWPRDMLLHLLVANVSVVQCENLTAAQILQRDSLALLPNGRKLSASSSEPECVFAGQTRPEQQRETVHEAARRVTDDLSYKVIILDAQGGRNRSPVRLMPTRRRDCRTTIAVSDKAQRSELVKLAGADKALSYKETPDGAALERCDAVEGVALVVAKTPEVEEIFLLNLRSLEQAIYFLGEQIRPGAEPIMVKHPGWGGGGAACHPLAGYGDPTCVPLFRIFELRPGFGEREEDYAAAVPYRGRRYFAGSPSVKCAYQERCAPAFVDRTGSVLTILSQLYSLAPSPDALRPPTRLLID